VNGHVPGHCPAGTGAGAGAGTGAGEGAGCRTIVIVIIFISAAPGIALQDTAGVTSVMVPLQAVIFLPNSKNAMIFLPSSIKNCLLVFATLLITNFCPLSHPFAAIVSSAHRFTY